MKRRPKINQVGFTLVELLIGAALAGVIMAAVLSSYTYIGRSLARLASYQALEAESRQALGYLSRDFSMAQKVKAGTTPTDATLTLVLPAGEVTYTYNSSTRSLSRTATFGVSPALTFLQNDSCQCTTFAFSYFTTSDSAPTSQVSPSANVPYSIKQIQAGYVIESPDSWSSLTRTRYQAASARFLLRNRGVSDGT